MAWNKKLGMKNENTTHKHQHQIVSIISMAYQRSAKFNLLKACKSATHISDDEMAHDVFAFLINMFQFGPFFFRRLCLIVPFSLLIFVSVPVYHNDKAGAIFCQWWFMVVMLVYHVNHAR